mgnify:CR=1 FL=1
MLGLLANMLNQMTHIKSEFLLVLAAEKLRH